MCGHLNIVLRIVLNGKILKSTGKNSLNLDDINIERENTEEIIKYVRRYLLEKHYLHTLKTKTK